MKRYFFLIAFLFPVFIWHGTAAANDALRDAVIRGEVHISPPFGSSGVKTSLAGVTADLATADAASRFSIRYKLWVLAGEPVWSFSARAPQLDTITLHRDGAPVLQVKRNSYLPAGSIHWNKGSIEVSVADDVMALARVYDFAFYLLVDRAALEVLPEPFRSSSSAAATQVIDGHPAIYRRYPGLMGEAGEWGWDVPGSPEWGGLFRSPILMAPDFAASSYDKDAYDAATGKEIMRRLLHANTIRKMEVISSAGSKVGDVRFMLHDLLSAIRDQHPSALDRLYGITADEDRQLLNIIAAYDRDLRKNGATPALVAEGQKIHRVMEEFSGELPSALVSYWKEAGRASSAVPSMSVRTQKIAETIIRLGVHPAEPLSKDEQAEIRAMRSSLGSFASEEKLDPARHAALEKALGLLLKRGYTRPANRNYYMVDEWVYDGGEKLSGRYKRIRYFDTEPQIFANRYVVQQTNCTGAVTAPLSYDGLCRTSFYDAETGDLVQVFKDTRIMDIYESSVKLMSFRNERNRSCIPCPSCTVSNNRPTTCWCYDREHLTLDADLSITLRSPALQIDVCR